jgi:alpha-tubulin suppressor-like RCC1 family protein
VYAWGSNASGQLGVGGISKLLLPHQISLPTQALKVSAGADHTLILMIDGSVYACGEGSFGQLGLESDPLKSVNPHPTKVNLPHPVKDISAGNTHSIFLTIDGKVYVCGNNSFGQLGGSMLSQSTPTILDFPHYITSITTSGYHNAAITVDGELYTWGLNTYGQLGTGSHGTNIITPTRIVLSYRVSEVATGNEHTAIMSEDGLVYTCGQGLYGQLGHGDYENRSLFTLVSEY